MKRYAKHLVSFLGLALVLAIVIPQRALADDDDPPSRVARLAYVQGNVSFQPAGTDEWVGAVVNRPLTTGDKLWNDNDSLSELHLGSAFIRLGGNTGFSFLNLTDNMTQIRLTEGTLNIRVRRLSDDEAYEIDTPNLAFSLLRAGSYKINVNEAGDATVVLVRAGEGEITGGGSAYTLHPHDVGTFYGNDQISADVESWDNSADNFDDWCAERDRHIDHSVSARYVSDDVIGYEDLDEYGGWRSTPDYGEVWFPHTTIVGWAPYHYGHWVYIAPWGYTWVDDAPWGFAPFHYGRWVVVGGVWGWVPAPPRPVVVGVAYVRPVYAPALVAWVGGPHFAVGVGIGGGAGVSVGWFPLGPREVYVPSYPVSRTYVQNVNITNTTVNTTVVNNYYNTTIVNKNVTVTNIKYVNQGVPGAVTATSAQAFTSAQPVARNVVRVDAREVAAAPVAVATPAVAPARQAVLGASMAARARPPEVLQTRAVVAKTTPPPPPPAFAKQQQMIQANEGRPLAVTQIRQIQPEPVAAQAHAAVKIAPAARPQEVVVKGPQPNSNRPGAQNNPGGNPAAAANNNANRPGNPNQPVNPPSNAVNRPGNPPPVNARPNTNANANANANTNANTNVPVTQKSYSDRPPNSRPNTVAPANPNPVNLQLDQKHAQETENLRKQQDLERQRVEQQQQQQRAVQEKKLADQQAQERLNQQHQEQQREADARKAQDQQAAQQRLNQQRQEQERAAEAQRAAQEQAQQRLNQQHQQQLEQLEQKHNAEEQKLQQRQQQERKAGSNQPPPKAQKNDKPSKDEKKDKPH